MSASAVREICIGVRELGTRIHLYESCLGLKVIRSGTISGSTALRLWGSAEERKAALMGRPDVPGSPQLRLVECHDETPARSGLGLAMPGPLGVGFTTRGINGPHARLTRAGIDFVSPPILLTPMAHASTEGAPQGPERYETFGRTPDGDFIVLIERVRATTEYGRLDVSDCSEPLHFSFVVTNLDACTHFMADVLDQATLLADRCSGSPFDRLLGLSPNVSFRFAMTHHSAYPTGRSVFMEFDARGTSMPLVPAGGRGLHGVRYDCDDLHATLARVPGGGGTLVKGPASIDDPLLGRAVIATIRSPFGLVFELWQRR